jgi:hypothetical protein
MVDGTDRRRVYRHGLFFSAGTIRHIDIKSLDIPEKKTSSFLPPHFNPEDDPAAFSSETCNIPQNHYQDMLLYTDF